MSRQRSQKTLQIVAVGTGLIIAFWVGRLTSSGESSASEASGAGSAPSHLSGRSDSPSSRDFFDRTRRTGSGQNKQPERLRRSVDQAQGTADALTRYTLTWKAIGTISPENWQEVLEGFRDAAKEKGWMDRGMYNEAVKRVGQVVGEDAVNHYLDQGQQIPHFLLYGWGMSHPHEAQAWAENFGTGQERLNNICSAVGGGRRDCSTSKGSR